MEGAIRQEEEEAMVDRAVRRAGAVAAMVGAVLGIVFNVLHPRGSGVSTVTGELRLVAESDIWLFDHFMLIWAVAISFIGLVVIGRSFDGEPAASWSRVAVLSAAVGGAVGLTLLMVDGMANHTVATEWARSESAGSLASATAVAAVSNALFTGLMFTFFGVTPLLYGAAVLTSSHYRKWLGYLSLLSGLLGLAAGSIQYLGGISPLTANILFPISSLAFTLWLLVMGWKLWKRSETVAPAPEAAAV
jgi:hypothetical protein